MRQRGSQALTGAGSNACAATWPGRPWRGGRLRILDADHLSFALKTPWSDGTRPLLLSPMELLEKLAALVPPPRFHLLRYHGVLAPRARDRDLIVPAKPVEESPAADGAARLRPAAIGCGGRPCWRGCFPPKSAPASIRTYLEGVGLSAMPPPRAAPEPLFEFAT